MTAMTTGHAIFITVVLLALAFFSYNAQRLVRYMRTVGLPEDRTDHPVERIKNLLLIGIGQTKILRDPKAGAMHASVFWGFVVLTIGTVEIIASGLFPGFNYARILPAPIYSLYVLSQEFFAVLVLVAVAALLYRRIVVKPARLQGDKVHSGDAILILCMIAALMLSLIFLGAFDFALHPGGATIFKPVSFALSHPLGGLSSGTLEAGRAVSWWSHALLILVFLNYLPYSKHLHVLTSLPNTYLSNTSGPGVVGAMRYMDLEADVEQYGASDVTQLRWKNLLDGYSCTECGRCTAACPANITGKLLSPRKIIVNTRQRLMELAPLATGDFGEFEHPHLDAAEGDDARQEGRMPTPCKPCSTTDYSTTTSPKRSCGRAPAAVRASRSVRFRSTIWTSSTKCGAISFSWSRASRPRSSRPSNQWNGMDRPGPLIRAIAQSGRRGWTSRRWRRWSSAVSARKFSSG